MWNESLRQVALAADNAWHALLEKQFGKRAGDVRYTKQGRGQEGTELRKAYDAFRAATDAWQATIVHRLNADGSEKRID